MFRILFAALFFCGAVLGTARADTPVGNWLRADGRTVFSIEPCATGLCGYITGMEFAHPTDPQPLNWQGQKMCGEGIIAVAPEQGQRNKWHGTIINPRNGNVWQATLTLLNGTLQLRGYFGIPLLGQTEIWTPYTGPLNATCHITG